MLLTSLLLLFQPDPEGERALRRQILAQPAAIQRFIERRAMCNHFAGEEPYDAARRREIGRAVQRYRCTRLDVDEARLRRQFRARPDTLRLIDATADLSGFSLGDST